MNIVIILIKQSMSVHILNNLFLFFHFNVNGRFILEEINHLLIEKTTVNEKSTLMRIC